MDETIRPSHHVTRIAQAMAPDPKAWNFLTLCYGESHCECGQEILWQYVLLRPTDGKRITIGSTCIEVTVPWLLQMDAVELADALKKAMRAHLAHLRRQRSHALFADTLAQATAQAFELDEWWRALQVRLEPYLNPPYARRVEKLILPDYWRKQRHGSLRALWGRSTGERAGSLTRRIATFRERIPLLESALTSYGDQMGIGKHRLWIQTPSARLFKDVDDVLPLIQQVDELRPSVAELFERYRLILSSVLNVREERQLHRLHERPLHASIRMLREWIALARRFQENATHELDAALESHTRLLEEVAGLKGRLLSLNDRYRAVMDPAQGETLDRLLKLWRDQQFSTLTRWRNEAQTLLDGVNEVELSEKLEGFHTLRERRDALGHALTDILNAPLTHFVLTGLEARIAELPLWDEMLTLAELRKQINAFEHVARELPSDAPVRSKARALNKKPLHACKPTHRHLCFTRGEFQGRARLEARVQDTLYVVPPNDASRAADESPVCCREGRVVSQSPDGRVMLVHIERHLPLSLEAETETLIARLARARTLADAT